MRVQTSWGPMSYIESGTGPAMVFVHGWPMQKETFLPITRILQKEFRCISFDLIDIGAVSYTHLTLPTICSV